MIKTPVVFERKLTDSEHKRAEHLISVIRSPHAFIIYTYSNFGLLTHENKHNNYSGIKFDDKFYRATVESLWANKRNLANLLGRLTLTITLYTLQSSFTNRRLEMCYLAVCTLADNRDTRLVFQLKLYQDLYESPEQVIRAVAEMEFLTTQTALHRLMTLTNQVPTYRLIKMPAQVIVFDQEVTPIYGEELHGCLQKLDTKTATHTTPYSYQIGAKRK